jgi:hypothetical protein
MNIQDIISQIKDRKGQNLSVVWEKSLKTRKGVTALVTKRSELVARTGIDYDKMKDVKEGRENGELPEQNAGLPWGTWTEFPFHISHKGTEYARFYPAAGLDFPVKTFYFINGVEAYKEECKLLCLASEFSKPDEDKPKCFTVKAENVKEILVD